MRNIIIALGICLSLSPAARAQTSTASPGRSDVRLYARLLAMTDTRSYDARLIDSVLASKWAPLRRAGALAIGQVGDAGRPGLSRLRDLLADRDPGVASNAAYALGLLVDSTSVPALQSVLVGRPGVAREAAWALGEIGSPARAAILGALASIRGDDDARTIQLLLAAAKLRPVPVAEIRPYLHPAKPSVQWAASYAIARFRAPAGARDLIALAQPARFASVPGRAPDARAAQTADVYAFDWSAGQRTRAEMGRGLARSAAGDSLADSALSVLTRLARDPHPHVRINAVRSLATYEARGRNGVVTATSDTDANVRIAAAQAIGTVLDSTLASWTPLWERDTSFTYRASILASAARAGAKLPQIVTWTAHNDWRYRAAALNAAAAITDSVAPKAAARSMLRDPDGRVRASAYGILAGNDTTPPPPAIRGALLAGLRDPDFYARATVLGNLARHAAADDAPAVLDAYALSLADSGNDARIAAIQFLASAWRKDSARFSPDLRRRLADLTPSSDPLVRAPADSVSIMRAWHSTTGNPRPLSWYQDIVRTYVVPALRGQTQRATLRTPRGDITLELFGADAPITVWNFMNLAGTGFYRGTGFHRVVPNFVAQDGDPRDDGNGGPGYAIRDEMNPRRYDRGALGMALSGPDTGGSQYFITHSPQPHLDGHYTVFGRVLSGYAALDAIVQGDRILSISVR